jgi:hypothetical protein
MHASNAKRLRYRTWGLVPLLSAIELDLALITASLPSLKQFFEQIFGGGIFNSNNEMSDHTYGMHHISTHSKAYDHTTMISRGADISYKRGQISGNESEENIIEGQYGDDIGKVMKVTEFEVSYESASAKSVQ